MNDLELKWKNQWGSAKKGISVLGVSLAGKNCRAAILKNGRIIVIPLGDFPRKEMESKNCTEALRLAFVLHAVRESAEKLLKEPITDAVIGVTGDNDLTKIKLCQDAAEIAGMNIRYVVSDSTLAALAVGRETQTSCKCAVFVVNNTTCSVGIYDIGDGVFEVKSRRGKDEVKADELAEILGRMYKEVLKASELKDVDKVYLVGAIANVPKIAETIAEIVKTGVSRIECSDDAVAIGAGFEGAISIGEVKDVMLLDVLPRTLGVEVLGKMIPVVLRDTTIPTKKSVRLSAKDLGTGRLSLNIYEGDSAAMSDNHVVGSCVLDDEKRAKLGSEDIEILFDVDPRMTLKADLKGANGVVSIVGGVERDNDSMEGKAVNFSHEHCNHCHGEGHTECHTCHGKGKEECPTCHGKKEVKCSKCGGRGQFSNCKKCGSTGKVDCSLCNGTGRVRERCPNCDGSGEVTKTRLRNCRHCHGSGVDRSGNYERNCGACRGTGQVEEKYQETCPTCGGSGRCREITCPRCNGKKEFTCSRCHGTGHAECSECSGTGKVTCGECHGNGEITCRDCNGGGDHVCVDCYGTGETVSGNLPNTSDAMQKVDEGLELHKQQKYVETFLLFREAAVKHHNTKAMRLLAMMYERGDAVYKNEEYANSIYCSAANAGDVKSLFCLGKKYLDGVGVATKNAEEQNRSEARRLLELATKKGCEEAESEYKKVATVKLVKNALSGVVGWRGKFEVPKFLLEADPAADQKDKDKKEAVRKAEKARKERARKRAEFFVRFFRGCWWLLFRVSAAGTYFYFSTKSSDGSVSENNVLMQVAGYLAVSYLLRPKLAETGYFLIYLIAGAGAYYVCGSYAASVWIMTLVGLTTIFMRFVGEKLYLAMITYPLLGGLIGFISSSYYLDHSHSSGALEIVIMLAMIAAPVVLLIVSLWLVNNAGGLCSKGKRSPSFMATFWTFAIIGGIATYYVVDSKREVTPQNEMRQSSEDKQYSMRELGLRYRDGNGVAKDNVRAKQCFAAAIKDGDHEAEYHLANILIEEGDISNGVKLLGRSVSAGYGPAICRLGELCMNDKKEKEAIRLFKKAAEKNSVEAMLHLGAYYAEKTGIFGGRRDEELAIKYYTMAASKGNDRAKKELQILKGIN